MAPNARRLPGASGGSCYGVAAAASVTPDRAISGASAKQRAVCAAQASERARAAVYIENVAERIALSGVTLQPRRRASHPIADHTRQGDQRCAHRAASSLCHSSFRESESSSLDRERSRRSCGGERHTRQGDQRCARRAASGLCRSSFRESQSSSLDRPRRRASHPTGRSAVRAPSSERPVPLKLPREREQQL